MPHLVAALIYLSQNYSYYTRGDRSPLILWKYSINTGFFFQANGTMPVKELDDYLDSDPDILDVEDLVEKDGDKCSAGQKDKLKKVLRDAKQRGTDAEKVTHWAYMTLMRR